MKRGQKLPLRTLTQFFEQSQSAITKIENALTTHLQGFIAEAPGIDSQKWKAKVLFPEFDTLREAISGLVSFTLNDHNDRALENKGSGVQRMVLLAVMKYIVENSNQTCIWGIDEPEAFLQPALQKKVFKELRTLASDMPIILTTHSPHFVDTGDTDTTHLFSSIEEPKVYERRPGKVFIKVDTYIDGREGPSKLEALRSHFGIERNDAWNVLPHNLLVEGEEDKSYLTALARLWGIPLPNILVAGGADNFNGYTGFLGEFCEGMNPKPVIVCLLDHDSKGKALADKLNHKKEKFDFPYHLDIQHVYRADGRSGNKLDFEIEDWVYPELIYRAVNGFLAKKGYQILTDAETGKRSLKAYQDKSILEFVNHMARFHNPDQPELFLDSVSLKLLLCRDVCAQIDRISQEELMAWNDHYPATKALLEKLARPLKDSSSSATGVG